MKEKVTPANVARLFKDDILAFMKAAGFMMLERQTRLDGGSLRDAATCICGAAIIVEAAKVSREDFLAMAADAYDKAKEGPPDGQRSLQLRSGFALSEHGMGDPRLLQLGRAGEDLEAPIRGGQGGGEARPGQDRCGGGSKPLQKTYLTGILEALE